MTWTGVIWHEAGTYGPGGAFQPQKDLGRRTLPVEPEFGMILDLDGTEWQVVETHVGYCYVRPRVIKAL